HKDAETRASGCGLSGDLARSQGKNLNADLASTTALREESDMTQPEPHGALSGHLGWRRLMATVVLAAVVVRVPWIHHPFVDAWCWRQSDVAMIARNFYEGGFNLLFPQINWGGGGPGYVGTEFPLVPFLAALGYLVLGEAEWLGRSVSLLFFLI